jgi:hypothetical protein
MRLTVLKSKWLEEYKDVTNIFAEEELVPHRH